MFVDFVTDNPNKIPAIRLMLEPQFAVKSRVLGASDDQPIADGVLVVDAGLRTNPGRSDEGGYRGFPLCNRKTVRSSESRHDRTSVRARRDRGLFPAGRGCDEISRARNGADQSRTCRRT